jgi:hypothetical protein
VHTQNDPEPCVTGHSGFYFQLLFLTITVTVLQKTRMLWKLDKTGDSPHLDAHVIGLGIVFIWVLLLGHAS